MSWHIYVSVLLIPLVVSHAIAYIRSFPLPLTFWVERRSFLRFAGIALAGFLFWQTGERVVRATGLSGQDRRFTGSYGATSINGEFPVVSWLNDVPPQTDIDSWKLSVHGLVKRDLSLGYSDLTSNDEMTATIDCTGGWHSEQVWRGVPLARLLDEAELLPEARSVKVTSATGYYRRFTIAEAREYLLATHVGDRLLSPGTRIPRPPCRAGQTRLRVGQVGDRHRDRQPPQVASAAAADSVAKWREDSPQRAQRSQSGLLDSSRFFCVVVYEIQ